ncbi:MAG: hypothetical protein AB1416_10445 [Actinomycetota bacterium]
MATLEASARNLHDRAYTCWVWTGRSPRGEPAWAVPVAAVTARDFSPRGPARVLARLVGAAVDAGADADRIRFVEWHGLVCLVLPGLEEDLAGDAVAEATPAPARAAVAALPAGVVLDGPPVPLGLVPGADTGVSRLARAAHVHPLRVVVALAGHGQPVDEERYPPELVASLREWGCAGEPPPPPPPSLEVEDDPCPRRRHARRVLRRILRMGKVGAQFHTEFDHLYRGLAPEHRADGLAIGEALIRAGLLGEKPSVGQRHVYLRREALPDIHALIDRGETRDPVLAAEWTAPAPGDAQER